LYKLVQIQQQEIDANTTLYTIVCPGSSDPT